eukprot:1141262-Pelagomonas_calceolata.AAC.3
MSTSLIHHVDAHFQAPLQVLTLHALKCVRHATACSYIWGRGALDVKFSVAALLEAASSLLQKGFQPQRTLMMSFGNDEEVRGARRLRGSQCIELLQGGAGIPGAQELGLLLQYYGMVREQHWLSNPVLMRFTMEEGQHLLHLVGIQSHEDSVFVESISLPGGEILHLL